jgi:amino acid adenylation domain-containing protein
MSATSISVIRAPERLHEFLLQHAAARPGHAAVIERDADGELHTTTYGQLRERAEAYAEALAGLGIDIGQRVVVDSDTSASAIAMLIACSMRGLTYIPVSPETPTPRVRSVAAAGGAVLHLQPLHGQREELSPELGTGRFGPDSLHVSRRPAVAVTGRTAATPTDPAYIVFTSGTTGRPKGVVMSHRAVLSFFRGMLAHDIVGPDDRVATTSPLQFDFSLLDVGLALGSGATVLPVPRAFLRWPRRFLTFLAETGATQVNGVPSIWRPALRHEPDQLASLHKLRGVLYSGEPFPLPELRQLRKLRSGLRIVNCYGSTESIACSFTDVPDPVPDSGGGVPIGPAHPGAELLLLDEDRRPVLGADVVGELYLRSPALFSGYWDDPVTTAEVLVPDPVEPRTGQLVYRTGDLAVRGEDGLFSYRSRADSQVKIRGNRVELGEVERRLLDLPGVGAATVLVPPRPDGEPMLCAFLAVAPEVALTEARISAFCKETLPDYMIPSEVHLLAEIPVTVNGKVDKATLLECRTATRP